MTQVQIAQSADNTNEAVVTQTAAELAAQIEALQEAAKLARRNERKAATAAKREETKAAAKAEKHDAKEKAKAERLAKIEAEKAARKAERDAKAATKAEAEQLALDAKAKLEATIAELGLTPEQVKAMLRSARKQGAEAATEDAAQGEAA